MAAEESPLHAWRIASPVGELALVVDRFGALVRIAFLATRGWDEVAREEPLAGRALVFDEAPCAEAAEQLEAYFARRRRNFELDLAPEGTAFQQSVWRELRRIPYGATLSYGELARRVGGAEGARAVGQANHVNPIPIVIPCHRVVGGAGEPVGFGGGLAVQRALLDLERGQRVLF